MIHREFSTRDALHPDLLRRLLHRLATFILITCAASLSLVPGNIAISAESRSVPNIVLILADDMGFSDAGCYGGEIQTPNLDRLARGGLRFTQFYNTARCWPSRACILTGYYAQQVRRDALPGLPGGAGGKRPAWARLLPELLRAQGYRSYHSGKWHVDGPVLAGGFDHSYSLNDHNRFFCPRQHELDDRPLPAVPPDSGYYATTAIAQHAIDMLAEHQQKHSRSSSTWPSSRPTSRCTPCRKTSPSIATAIARGGTCCGRNGTHG